MSEIKSTLVEEIKLPSDLQTISKKPGIHENFRSFIDALSCEYISNRGVLRVISEKPDVTKKRISMAKDLHFRTLKYAKESDEALVNKNLYVEEFDVAEDLIGLSIGTKGRNINSVNEIKGVHADLIKGTCRFRVKGETLEAVKAAREKLEYVREGFTIPRVLGESILDNDGAVVKDVMEKSHITRIEAGKEDLTEDDEAIPFYFVGTSQKVADAKALFQYHLTTIQNMKIPLGSMKSVTCEECRKETNSNHTELLSYEDPKSRFRELLTIPKELMGLAVGKHGSNIKKAVQMKGIVDIKAKDNFFEIFGNDKEGIEEARKLLDFSQEFVEFDHHRAPKIIGKNKAMLLQIQSNSGVFRIEVNERTNEKTTFKIIGMAHTIPIAKILMDGI